ncbi:MAG: hypothetical protein WCD06_01800, partial [Candidatus Sulfotelmatobacter sp.]
DQHNAGGQFVVGLLILMKLFFAFSDHSFGIGGMALLNRQPRQGEFCFRDGLLKAKCRWISTRFTTPK